jgi:hypothetical protein
MTDATATETTEQSGAGLSADEKRAIAMIVIGVAVVVVVAECIHRMERRFSRRHPFLTELVEEIARPPWPFR